MFIVKKFGMKRTLRAFRVIITLHWLFKFIIYLRVRFFKGPIVAISEGINDIVLNDEEYVHEMINN